MNIRNIQIDEDTAVGYDYPNKKYYVTNKGTTTTRNTAEQIVEVLRALGITEYTSENLRAQIELPLEDLDYITYTLEDSGSYIKTLQFNEWEKYPITLDCEKGNIFIKNTNILYPLDSDEASGVRIESFCDYYLRSLGLNITLKDMGYCYGFLVNQYVIPSFYNTINKDTETGTLSYSNIFKMNNFKNISAITCSGTRNPNNEFDIKNSGEILRLDTENNTIYLKNPIDSTKYLAPGFQVTLEGTSYEEEGVEYSADGIYTIDEVALNKDNKVVNVQVEEPIPAYYEYPYPTFYVESLACNIYSMQRENNIIKVSAKKFPKDLIIGDTIHVKGASVGTGLNFVSLDGPYTVQNISGQLKQITDTVYSMGGHDITIDSSKTELKEGDALSIKGAGYNDNLIYTITGIGGTEDGRKVLTVMENIPMNYGKTVSKESTTIIYQPSAAGNKIILNNTWINQVINLGDNITIGTENPATYSIKTVIRNSDNTTTLIINESIPSEATVSTTVTITSNTNVELTSSTILYYNIYVEENIPTDFVSSSSQQATFYKEVFISDIVDMQVSDDKTVVTLLKTDSIQAIMKAYIHTEDKLTEGTIESIDANKITFTENLNIEMPEFPILYSNVPKEEISINVTDVTNYLENTIPTGDFIVDDFSSCQNYIKSLATLDKEISGQESQIPELKKEDIDDKMYEELKKGTEIDIEISANDSSVLKASFKGLYSDIYPSTE